MDKYDPSSEPNPDEWLRLSEPMRNDLIREYHAKAKEPLADEALDIHTALHLVVENQIALGTKPVPETVRRLIRQGLNRHEAIHAVAAVLSNDIFETLNHEGASFDLAGHRRKLERLTAKRWRKGQW